MKRQLNFEVIENNYAGMSNLTLDTITIYGLDDIPNVFHVNKKEVEARLRPSTQIVELHGLALPMNENHRLTWSKTKSMLVDVPEKMIKAAKYRIDCFPDPGKEN